MTRIGVLALQGDVEKHRALLKKCGAQTMLVRKAGDLVDIKGLVIPGGESTTIGKLLVRFDLFQPIKKLIQDGLPVFGTCAGLILLATDIIGYDQPHFGVLDVAVARNAYGPQVESFEADITLAWDARAPLRAVFIRAPIIKKTGKGVEILARFEDAPVLVRQKNILASSFHPELTDDLRIHKYFLSFL